MEVWRKVLCCGEDISSWHLREAAPADRTPKGVDMLSRCTWWYSNLHGRLGVYCQNPGPSTKFIVVWALGRRLLCMPGWRLPGHIGSFQWCRLAGEAVLVAEAVPVLVHQWKVLRSPLVTSVGLPGHWCRAGYWRRWVYPAACPVARPREVGRVGQRWWNWKEEPSCPELRWTQRWGHCYCCRCYCFHWSWVFCCLLHPRYQVEWGLSLGWTPAGRQAG